MFPELPNETFRNVFWVADEYPYRLRTVIPLPSITLMYSLYEKKKKSDDIKYLQTTFSKQQKQGIQAFRSHLGCSTESVVVCLDGNEASTEAVFWVWPGLERGVARAREGHVIAPGSYIKLSVSVALRVWLGFSSDYPRIMVGLSSQ